MENAQKPPRRRVAPLSDRVVAFLLRRSSAMRASEMQERRSLALIFSAPQTHSPTESEIAAKMHLALLLPGRCIAKRPSSAAMPFQSRPTPDGVGLQTAPPVIETGYFLRASNCGRCRCDISSVRRGATQERSLYI